MPRRAYCFAAFALVAGLLTTACDSTEPPGPGSIFISSSANQPEPNSQFFQYEIFVDNGSPRIASVFEQVSHIVNGLAPGAHEVRLSGVPASCNIGPNPRPVNLRGDDTALVVFTILCPRTTGDLQVTITTTGTDPDPNGYLLRIGNVTSFFVPTNFNQLLPFFPAGTYSISLSDVAANCSAGPSQSITVTPGQTSTVSFGVTCTPVAIVKVVASATGTEVDADGFVMTIGSAGTRIAANGTFHLRVPNGTSSWSISDLQPNCALAGASSGSVTVAQGDTATITVDATCAAIGYGAAGTTAADAAADTLANSSGSSAQSHDLLQLTTRYATDWLILVLRFTRPVGSVGSNVASGLQGVLDLDVDENASTGAPPLINSFGGTASQGADYRVNFFLSNATTARLERAGSGADTTIHLAPLALEGDSVVVKIPLAKLGPDDGRMSISAVLGTADRPTDIAPNSGVILARPASAVLAGASAIKAAGDGPVRQGSAQWPPSAFSPIVSGSAVRGARH